MFFFKSLLLNVPEFRYINRIDNMNKGDINMIVESLDTREELECKIIEENKKYCDSNGKGQKNTGVKKEKEHKDKAKPVIPTFSIEVECPKIEQGDNFMIFER